jgi:hypothetical protein
MNEVRIKLDDSIRDILIKMSDGNPGALNALMEMLKPNNIDPDAFIGNLNSILLLDSFGIYGTDIYILHAYICNYDLPKMIAVLRATQLGFFSRTILKDACHKQDRSGKDLIPVDDLYKQVKEYLPNFDSK